MPIIVENIIKIYRPGTPFEKKVLDEVNLTIKDGEITGIIGSAGAGKTTLLELIKGLTKQDGGSIIIDGIDVDSDKWKSCHHKVGLIFQFPEDQFFEGSVFAEIAFGLKKIGHTKEYLKKAVEKAMSSVGLPYEKYKDRNPFSLSGGEKRRIAIASIVAMEPDYILFDEPTVGLDLQGRLELLNLIKRLKGIGKTIVIVSHDLDLVAGLASTIYVLNKGKMILKGSPSEVFYNSQMLTEAGLGVPRAVSLIKKLEERGIPIKTRPLTMDELTMAVKSCLGGGRGAK